MCDGLACPLENLELKHPHLGFSSTTKGEVLREQVKQNVIASALRSVRLATEHLGAKIHLQRI